MKVPSDISRNFAADVNLHHVTARFCTKRQGSRTRLGVIDGRAAAGAVVRSNPLHSPPSRSSLSRELAPSGEDGVESLRSPGAARGW